MGGAEKVLVDLVNNLDREKFDVTLCTVFGGENEKRLSPGITYKKLVKTDHPFLKRAASAVLFKALPPRKFYSLFLRGAYDVECAYLEGVNTLIIGHSSNVSAKKIAFVHSDLSQNYELAQIYADKQACLESYRGFDDVVFVSQKALEGFESAVGKLDHAKMIHNVVDEREILRKSTEPISVEKQRFTMITVGRLCEQKGYDRLLEAAEKLNRDGLAFDLWIFGEGKDRAALEQYIAQHQLDNVKLMGITDNPAAYMSRADLFVCSSRVEGYSTVLTEAAILGLPVVTTQVAGVDEIFDSGKYALVVKNDTESLYEGLRRVLADPGIYGQLKKNAALRKGFFSMEKSLGEYEALFLK